MPLDNNNIPYRNSCKDCEYERYCPFEPRDKMFNRKCYLDYIAKKMKITPQLLLKRCSRLLIKYELCGLGFDGVKNYDYEYWIKLSGRERKEYVSDNLKWCLRRAKKDETEYHKSEGQLYAAMLNTYFNCWLDDDYIHCARCGKLIKNSKQRNRRFCEKCIGYQYKDNKYAFCSDCGKEFYRDTNNQHRCFTCQKSADKVAARERAKRYRERKNHGSG